MRIDVRAAVFASITAILIARSLIPVSPLVSAQITSAAVPHIADVHIGVLGLFHPRQLTIRASGGTALVVHAGRERVVLERSTGVDSASIRVSGSGVLLAAGTRVFRSTTVTISDRENNPVDFVLAIPKKISRQYRGTLEIEPSGGTLLAIVGMDREEAVASIVAAESASDTPLEALKAEVIAARSYLVASRGRHHNFDFCDTTHCQFLREAPAPGSAVANAVEATRGLVLAYDSEPIAAMYTRSCSGRTRTPAELGLPSAAYPYYSVECRYCRAHPMRWSSRISAEDAAVLHRLDESERLSIDRRLGWSAVPSNDFIAKEEKGQVTLEGTGQGHGIGLCQSGARAMAEEGIGFRQILSHYYPNTTIVSWKSVPRQNRQHP